MRAWIYEWVRLVPPPKCLAWRLSIKSLKSIVVNRLLSILLSWLSLSYRFDANTWFQLEGCKFIVLLINKALRLVYVSLVKNSGPSFRQVSAKFFQVSAKFWETWPSVGFYARTSNACISRTKRSLLFSFGHTKEQRAMSVVLLYSTLFNFRRTFWRSCLDNVCESSSSRAGPV